MCLFGRSPLVIIRSLAEYFRLLYFHGDAQVTPYVAGALFPAIALAAICFFASLYRVSIGIAIATVIVLLIYKIMVIG